MAFALGFAGGFADEIEAPPEPPPVVVGGGGTLVRRRWIARPIQAPTPRPVRARARTVVRYRLAARVVAVRPRARIAQPISDLGLRRARLAFVGRATPTRVTTKAASTVTVDQKQLSRFAAEIRELNELAVALALID